MNILDRVLKCKGFDYINIRLLVRIIITAGGHTLETSGNTLNTNQFIFCIDCLFKSAITVHSEGESARE